MLALEVGGSQAWLRQLVLTRHLCLAVEEKMFLVFATVAR